MFGENLVESYCTDTDDSIGLVVDESLFGWIGEG